MKRMLITVLAMFAIASVSHAVSLSVVSNKTVYYYGETITLTVVGDDSGATTYGIFGQLDYSGALVDNGTRTQITLGGAYGKWTRGVLSAGDNGTTAFSYAFNQIAGLTAQSATNLPGVLSTVTLIANGYGVVNINWHTALDGTGLDFFGLTNAPGTSFYIISCDGCTPPGVPEPTTGLLLGLGLLALGGRRLRRARRPFEA